MAFGIYDADGKIRVTVVDGSSFVGVYADDGSLNVITDSIGFGLYHACGAIRVTDVTDLTTAAANSFYAADGSMNVTTTDIPTGAIRVDDTGGGGGGAIGTPIGLLLALTHSTGGLSSTSGHPVGLLLTLTKAH